MEKWGLMGREERESLLISNRRLLSIRSMEMAGNLRGLSLNTEMKLKTRKIMCK